MMPEVHVKVNIAAPMPGTQGSAVVAAMDKIHCDPEVVVQVEDPTALPADPFNPPVRLLLELMDLDQPVKDMKYVDIESELVDEGIGGIWDLYNLPLELLANFGNLRQKGAHRLQEYVRQRLIPLIKPTGVAGECVSGVKQEGVADESGSRQVDMAVESGRAPGAWKGKGRLMKEESKDVIVVWSDDESVKDEIKEESPPIAVLKDEEDTDTDISE
jgi:hypothetical protein